MSLGAAVRDPSLPERADCLSESVALLALVQSGLAASTELGAFEPVEHEERALDAAMLLQRQIELVLALYAASFFSIAEGATAPAFSEATKRTTSCQCSRIARGSHPP